MTDEERRNSEPITQMGSQPPHPFAEAHEEDRNCDPVDHTKPSVSAHATVDDFSQGSHTKGPVYPASQADGEMQDFTVILQGILANVSTDPTAVEKNTSLAAQYLDAARKKVDERFQEDMKRRQDQYEQEMEDMVGPTGTIVPMGTSIGRPPLPLPPDMEDYVQVRNDE